MTISFMNGMVTEDLAIAALAVNAHQMNMLTQMMEIITDVKVKQIAQVVLQLA